MPADIISVYVLEGGLAPAQTFVTIPTGLTAPIFAVLVPPGSFYVRVRARSGATLGNPSNEIRLHVGVPLAPSAPDAFQAVVNGQSLALAFRPTFLGGVPASYELTAAGLTVPLGSATTVVFPVVPPGTYNVAVRARNAAGVSASSNIIAVTVPSPCSGVPLAPVNFLVYSVGATVSVIWDAAGSGAAATGFVVNVSGAINTSVPISTRSISAGVPPGTYTLSVAASNACGTSAATATQTITIP